MHQCQSLVTWIGPSCTLHGVSGLWACGV
jgi:hypothetical protein